MKLLKSDFSKSDLISLWLGRHWVYLVSTLLGIYVSLPLMAPVFMAAGWTTLAKAIYWVYSFFCHQLPERSYFLFGPHISYSLAQIHAVWPNSDNLLILRQFTGNLQMGWKMAWSDRMVSMYTSIWLFGLIWYRLRKKVKPLPWWGFLLLILPLAIDGFSHLFSELSGFGTGFRDTNAWLASLTNHIFPDWFYAGDAWGSFNAWMRFLTGILFGLGTAWFGYPQLERAFYITAASVEYKLQYRDWLRREKNRLESIRQISKNA